MNFNATKRKTFYAAQSADGVSGEQKQGTGAGNRSCTKGHAAAAATRETVQRYLLMPDAIKHFINESFQLLARDFTLTCPSSARDNRRTKYPRS